MHHPSIVRRLFKGSARGFTLIELLVVVAIMVLLMAVLIPSLQKARRQAARVACASQLKQVGLGLLIYAQENGGWFPRTYYAAPNILLSEGGSFYRPDNIMGYIPTPKMLRCPAQSPALATSGWGAYASLDYWGGSYWFVGAYGSRLPGWYGWIVSYNGPSTETSVVGSPIPNVAWAGSLRQGGGTGYGGGNWTMYINNPSTQPIAMDCYDPAGWWQGYSMPYMENNHAGMGGMNIVFVDGHVAWRHASVDGMGKLTSNSEVRPRYQPYVMLYW